MPHCASLAEMRALRDTPCRTPSPPLLACRQRAYDPLPSCHAPSPCATTTTTTTTLLPSGETQQVTTVIRTPVPADACLLYPYTCPGRRPFYAWCASCQRKRLFPEVCGAEPRCG